MDTKNDSIILATASYDFDIKIWHAHNGECARTFSHPESQTNALAISPDRFLLGSAGYQHVRMYDINSNSPNHLISYDGIQKNVTALGFQEDGKWMYTGGEDCTAKIWDIRGARSLVVARIFQIDSPVLCATLHPNQAQLFIGDQSGIIHIWDVKTKHSEQLIPEVEASIQHLDVSSDGKMLAAVTNKGRAYVWRLDGSSTGAPPRIVPVHKINVHSTYALKVRFAPDCNTMVTTSADCTAKIWRTDDFSLVTTLTDTQQKWVWDAAYSGDSQYLFTGSSDYVARLWSIKTSSVKRRYQGHRKVITALAFKDRVL
ncbi:target of rapamycin complex subunit lst8 [Hyalella azteca]|uniref:Target of rapamycin complex subunit lst8 n=1 Tax=Hyalella azteca TaxID=294128 RepID=A0A8B7PPN2_HYAAZ|nr:target of rapamycin complex subunit lst8 [Hyalella azteca]